MAYRYQKELDLLEATKEELNITDAQYDELTDAIKAQGGSAEGGDEPQFSIKSYRDDEPIFNFNVLGTSIYVAFRCKEGDWFSYENGEQVEWSWKNEKLGQVYIFYGQDETGTGPSIAEFSEAEGASGKGKANASKNPVPPPYTYGKYCVAMLLRNSSLGDFTVEDFEDAKKNLKIKIG